MPTFSWCQTAQQDSLWQLIQQEQDDSLKAKQLLRLARTYNRSDWRKQNEYGRQAFMLVQHSDYDKLKVDALNTIGGSKLRSAESPDSALFYYEQGLAIAKSRGFPSREADLLNNIGILYFQIGAADKAFENYQKAIEIAEENELPVNLCRYLNNMAIILKDQEEYDKALGYYNRALKTARELDNKRIIAALLTNIGVVYELQKEYDLALEHYTESLQIKRSINDKFGEVITLCNVGDLFREQGMLELALRYHQEGIKLATQVEYKSGEADCLCGIGETLVKLKQYEEAIQFAERGLAISEKIDYLEGQVNLKEITATSNAAIGKFAEAYEVQKEYIALKDSLNASRKVNQINELEAKYQLRQKETENQLLQEKQIRQQEALQKRNILNIAALVIVVLISLLAFSYYRSSRRKQKYNEELKQEVEQRTLELKTSNQELLDMNQELERFAFIASHDLKEPLRNIILFNELIQKELKPHITNEVKDYFSFVNNSGQQMYFLIESALEFSKLAKTESLYQPTDVRQIIEQTKENIKGMIKEKNAVVEYGTMPTIQSNPEQLYLIFKNLIENGIKYNENTTPKVSITYQNGSDHLFVITDNGIGIAEEYHEKVFQMFERLHNQTRYPGSGLGLSIVEKTLKRLGGTISLTSTSGKGSTFMVRIPNVN